MLFIFVLTSQASSGVLAEDTPQPIYPRNLSVTTSETDPPLGVPSFTWTAVTGANEYRLQVGSDGNCDPPSNLDIVTNNLSYTPQALDGDFKDGEWCWRVRVEDPSPVSTWSPTVRFSKNWATATNKPNLLSPLNGGLITYFTAPTFSWTPVMGAAEYRFEIATSQSGFSIPLLSIDTISTTVQPENRLPNGTYFWRVIPMDIMNHLGRQSDIQSFYTSYGTGMTGMVPTPIDPQDESFPTFTPTFHWTSIIGAEHYFLEYTTNINCDFSVGEHVETHQTYYTPTDTFTNGTRYCWHVRAEAGPAVGDWSETWHFQKQWDLKPILLTPTDFYQVGLYPVFSWTPVPGAARYQIQISRNSNFTSIYKEDISSNTTYALKNSTINTTHYWWRVLPIDGGGNIGTSSNSSDFQSAYTSTAPILVSPLYYYPPTNDPGFSINPVEDRRVAFPIFQWHRVLNPAPVGGIYAAAYRIQVDDNSSFTMPVWEYDTENTSATPTAADNFTPNADQDYFWRVCPLDKVGGDCRVNPETGDIWWSQAWKARFDSRLQLQPTTGDSPVLLRPMVGQESVEATPLLEWLPYTGATQYQVQVSRDSTFSTYEISKTVDIPAYSPEQSLAQRSLGKIDYGTFYWHVRGNTSVGWSDWSETWRFQIAAQSEWRYSRSLGDNSNQLLIGDDQADEVDSMYDLTTLFAAQSEDAWYLGFDANLTTSDMTYVFYLDLDNLAGSGATLPPVSGYDVSTIPEHQPEFAIFVNVMGGVVTSSNTLVYAWDGDSWGSGKALSGYVGNVFSSNGYVELKLPNVAIGMNQETSSMSVMLFSVNKSSGVIQDTVPQDLELPGNSILSNFSAVSEHMNLILPANTATGDPSTIASILPFYWDWPTGSGESTPFAGSVLEVDLDPDYSAPAIASSSSTSNSTYYSENSASLPTDIVGDNIYYWRVQPRYKRTAFPEVFGAWTSGWSFHRWGIIPQNLHTSFSFATPSFSWDMAEGAETYHLQVATDDSFIDRVIDIDSPLTSYTPTDPLPQGHYYWRVSVNRYSDIVNQWSVVEQFTLRLPVPTRLTPNQENITHTPTFCWDTVIVYEDTLPVFTAWKYRVQVSRDPDFSNIYDQIDTQNNCWTPRFGYLDGIYYWHVAMLDGNSNFGDYSPTATFTKLYPAPVIVHPTSQDVPRTPTFAWSPVEGAATYVIEVSLSPSFSPLYDTVETMNTRYTPTTSYELDHQYYWRVAILDRDGIIGPFAEAAIWVKKPILHLPVVLR